MAETISMAKKIATGQVVSMAKEDGTPIKVIFMGINWDKQIYSGEEDLDIDMNGFLTDDSRKLPSNDWASHLVNYFTWNNYGESAYPWCWYSGDNTTGDDDCGGYDFNGKHYDEAFIIYADKFPPNNATQFTLGLSISKAREKGQTFSLIENAKCTICDFDDPSVAWEYDLTNNPKFNSLNAVEVGKLVKSAYGLQFKPIGMGYYGGMPELFKNFGLEITE